MPSIAQVLPQEPDWIIRSTRFEHKQQCQTRVAVWDLLMTQSQTDNQWQVTLPLSVSDLTTSIRLRVMSIATLATASSVAWT